MRARHWLRFIGLAAAATAITLVRRNRRLVLTDRVAVILGGSRGLGLALARQLAHEGARVALLARTQADLESAQAAILHWEGQRPLIVTCDATRREAVAAAIDEVVAQLGRVDVLANVAGTIVVGPQDHMRHGDFERAMSTHFWGPLYAMEAVAPIMRAQGGGRIVNVSSIGGRVAFPHLLPYTASKFALVGLSDGMRAELAKDGIFVTTVCPGLMRTGSYVNIDLKGQHRKELAWFAVLASVPGLTMSAGRAARRIVRAIERGERSLTLGLPAKLAVLAQAIMPDILGALMGTVNRMLPPPLDNGSAQRRSGWESRSRWVPSRLTSMSDRAARQWNELKGHSEDELEPVVMPA